MGAAMLRITLPGVLSPLILLTACSSGMQNGQSGSGAGPGSGMASTAIKHVVVIFNENISFDHYFGTYPIAANLPGEPPFSAAAGTLSPNGLHGTLLTANPNACNPKNGTGATDPFRLNRSQAANADQKHGYRPQQTAFDNGAMDLFPLCRRQSGFGDASGQHGRQFCRCHEGTGH